MLTVTIRERAYRRPVLDKMRANLFDNRLRNPLVKRAGLKELGDALRTESTPASQDGVVKPDRVLQYLPAKGYRPAPSALQDEAILETILVGKVITTPHPAGQARGGQVERARAIKTPVSALSMIRRCATTQAPDGRFVPHTMTGAWLGMARWAGGLA
jgi:hypothetical protein